MVNANVDFTFSSFTTTTSSITTSQPPNTPYNKLLFFGNDLHGNL